MELRKSTPPVEEDRVEVSGGDEIRHEEQCLYRYVDVLLRLLPALCVFVDQPNKNKPINETAVRRAFH